MRRAKSASFGPPGAATDDAAPPSRRTTGARRKPPASPTSGRRERGASQHEADGPRPLPAVERIAATIPPEEYLARALGAKTTRSRGIWARRGLASRGLMDRTTQSMLLRQLYLAYYEERRFDKALDVSEQGVGLGILPDVAHQDAARAAQALGETERAAGHLRVAARIGPPARKAFHWWTLGSLYYLAHRYDDALGAMTRAARWGTTDKPLYQGHIALIRCAAGEQVEDLGAVLRRLADVPAGQGYGRFVLGQLAFYDHRWDEAKRYLESFLHRTLSGRAALAIALDGEVRAARATLERIAST